MEKFIKKVAIITGASQGIGFAIAKLFSENGFSIAELKILIYYKNEAISRKENINNIISSFPVIDTTKQKHFGFQCDVSNFQKVIETENYMGSIDILINAAGICKDNLLLKVSNKEIQEIININLLGTIYMSKEVSKRMIKQNQGCIINIGSIIGLYGNKGQTIYSTSKSGLIGFTKSLAKELGSKGITVNLIAPGFIENTEMTNKISQEKKEQILSKIILKKFGTVNDIALTSLFLVKSHYITGQIIQVDGGLCL